ncbi:hypothetical protein OOK44_36970 [Streptomyces cellulosae]|uniref:hypothetical protein n=1 Tax=Streptomyces cellulosae TaxID=1968 RepID=UPI0022553EA5|nr:hypothetical protein [Streptomyces cellulosae]
MPALVKAIGPVHPVVGELVEPLLTAGLGESVKEAVGHSAVGGVVGQTGEGERAGDGCGVEADAEESGARDEDDPPG